MTTILGVQNRNGVILAADMQVTAGDRPYSHPEMLKIVEVGHLVVAAAGAARLCDYVQTMWKPPAYDNSGEYKYILTKVVPMLRSDVEASNFNLKEDESFQLLIAINGRLFEIDSTWTVLMNDKFYGIGTGAPYGLGALAAGTDIEKAVKIANKFDIYTGPKVQIVKQGVTNG